VDVDAGYQADTLLQHVRSGKPDDSRSIYKSASHNRRFGGADLRNVGVYKKKGKGTPNNSGGIPGPVSPVDICFAQFVCLSLFSVDDIPYTGAVLYFQQYAKKQSGKQKTRLRLYRSFGWPFPPIFPAFRGIISTRLVFRLPNQMATNLAVLVRFIVI